MARPSDTDARATVHSVDALRRAAVHPEEPGVLLESVLGRLALAPLLLTAAGIADALSELHQAGLVHADVRPSNILIHLESGRANISGARSPAPSADAWTLKKASVPSSLVYMAPERTGRLSSAVDARADLYALGVCLYQLATGRLPFVVSVPEQWVHAHVAMRPIPPAAQAQMPEMLQRILLRLLEKEPEDRYQTAAGLAHDLRECRARLEASGEIALFTLGRRDTPGRLSRRSRLQGRTQELETLASAVSRVQRTGSPEVVLVSGYSGIGKSSLVRELLAQGLPQDALVATGKFDDLESDAPYATLTQAFRGLCRWLLAKPANLLDVWKTALKSALGGNASIAVELVPELEAILGPQPPTSWLPAAEAQRLVHASLRQLLRVFAARQRPLIVFLDDLQWLDSASMDLIEHLLLDQELYGVLFLGAYRVESVSAAHPLHAALRRLVDGGRAVSTVPLAPLATPEIEQVVADLLASPPESTTKLARIVEEKTGGSPFFVRQFLTALVEEELLWFDQSHGAWAWNLLGIEAKGSTDNLTDLLLERLARLPEQTQRALEILACLGVRSNVGLLAALASASEDEHRACLQVAVDAGVLVEIGDDYAFSHDRLLTASYSRIAERERPSHHLRIGRALRARGNGNGLFEAVRHLNRAVELLHDTRERLQLAELNLQFARRSRATAASATVVAYLEQALRLLPSDHWQTLPGLSFDLALSQAESLFVSGQHAQAEALLRELPKDLELEPRGRVVCLQLDLYVVSGRLTEALSTGLDYLRQAGVSWGTINEAELARHYARLLAALGSREVADLAGVPALDSPLKQVIMEVCAALLTPAFATDDRLVALLTLHMATLSIEHGHSDHSASAYGWLSGVLGTWFGDYELGFEFATLGSHLAQLGNNRFAARALIFSGTMVGPRTESPQAGRPWLLRAIEASERLGDVIYGVHARVLLVIDTLNSGSTLEEAERQADAAIAFADRQHFKAPADRIRIFRSFIRGLREVGHEPGSLSLELDEHAYARSLGLSSEGWYYWVKRLQARYYAGDFVEARASARQAKACAQTRISFPGDFELWLFSALAEAACARTDDLDETLERIYPDEQQLVDWAARSPALFANKAALVRAERARIMGLDADAERGFEQAARLARQHGLVNEEALAHELSARIYSARGITSVARAKLLLARACYFRWGALGKVALLDAQIGSFDESSLGLPLTNSLEQLDVSVLVTALQAVSSSLELDKLIDALMKSALQNAAAERGLLVLVAGEPRVRARATSEGSAIRVTPEDRPLSLDLLPESILHYVLRSGERVSTRDGVVPAPFRGDPYLARQLVRSFLCVPIVVRGKAVGAMYFENTLTRQSYGARGLAVLDLIAAQAGISLQNAQLYAGLQEAQQRMAHAERASRTATFSWRPQTQESQWSDEVSTIYGIEGRPSLEQLRARTHPEDLALFDDVVSNSARYERQPVDLRLLMPDGAIKHLAIIASRWGPDEYVGTIRDVTEAKQAEEALERTQAKLADMTRVASLAEMSAAIAHEVNQPMTAIALDVRTCLRRLEEARLDTKGARAAAERIERDANRAGAVLQRLRALFNRQVIAKAPLDLNDAISEVLALVRSRIRAAGVTLRLELGSELAPALGDRVQLQQVVMNLLSNALDAMSKEEQPRILTLRTLSTESGRIRCEIADRGPGIPEDAASRIFEPLYSTKSHGMGMGLSICSSIIASHGGELSVRGNSEGRGSTFFFELSRAGA